MLRKRNYNTLHSINYITYIHLLKKYTCSFHHFRDTIRLNFSDTKQ